MRFRTVALALALSFGLGGTIAEAKKKPAVYKVSKTSKKAKKIKRPKAPKRHKAKHVKHA